MSNSIDQRIVEMQFDNSQFERGIASTLKSLLSLEQGLQMKNGVSGIESVQAAAEKLSFSKVEGEVGGLSSALEGLKGTATSVFDHITNGVNTLIKGYSLVKGIFSAGIGAMAISGGWNRASNINKAAFKLDAMGIGWANVQKQVSAAVDGTAYSLDAAASAAAMFASSGVEVNKTLAETTEQGDQMQQSLKAVANLASVSGSSYEEMANIFAKVAAQGKLSGMQVQSLAFHSVDAASLMKKQLNMSAEEFESAQRKGLIDFQTFVNAVNAEYGDAAGLANKSFDGALANMKSALSRTFADLFQYGQMAVVPVFNGIRETINMVNNALNPLMRTWSTFDKSLNEWVLHKGVLIRGFEDFASSVGKAFHDWGGKWDAATDNISKNSKLIGKYKEHTFDRFARIFQMVADGLEGPVKEFNDGVYDLAKGLLDLGSAGREVFRLTLEALSPIGMAFQDMFGGGAFADATKRFYKGVSIILESLADLHAADGYINGMRAAFQILFGLFKGVGSAAFNIIGGAIQGFVSTVRGFMLLAGHMVDMFDMMKRAGVETFEALGITLMPLTDMVKGIPFLEQVFGLLESIPSGLGIVIDALSGKEKAFERLTQLMSDVGNNLGGLGSIIGDAFASIGAGIEFFANAIGEIYRANAPAILDGLKVAFEGLTTVLLAVPYALSQVWEHLSKLASLNGADLKSLTPYIEGIRKSFETFFSEAFSGDIDVSKLAKNLKNSFDVIKGRVQNFAKDVFDGLPEPVQNFVNKLSGIYDKVAGFVGGIIDRLKAIKDTVVEAFDNSGLSLEPFMEFFGSIRDAFSEFFGNEDRNFDVKSLVSKIVEAFDSLKDEVGPKFEEFVKSIVDSIYDNLDPALQSIWKWVTKISTPFENLGTILQNVGDQFGSFSLPDLFSKNPFDKSGGLGGAFELDTEKVEGFGLEAFSVIQALESIGDLIWAPAETIKKVFSEGLSGAGEAFRDFVDNIPEDEVKEFIGFVSTIGIDAGVVVGLFNMSRAVEGVARFFEGAGKLFKSLGGALTELKGTFSAAATSMRLHSILEIAIAIGILVAALIALTFVDSKKLWDVLPILGILAAIMMAMTVLIGIMSGLGGGFSKIMKMNLFMDFQGFVKIASAMVSMAIAVGILALSLKMLAGIDGDSLVRGGNALGQVMLMLAGLAFVLGRVNKGGQFEKAGASMVAMAVAIGTMYIAIKLFAGMDSTEFTEGFNRVAIISGIFIALAALMALMSSIGGGAGGSLKGTAASMIAMVISIIALSMVIQKLADIPGTTILKGLLVIIALEALLIGLVAMTRALSKVEGSARSSIKAIATVLALTLAIGIIAAAVAGLAWISSQGGDIVTATETLVLAILALGTAVALIGKAGGASMGGAATLLAMGAAIGVFVAGVLLLTQIPWEIFVVGLINLGAAMGVFAIALAAFGLVGKFLGTGLLTLSGAFWTFSISVAVLAAALFIAVGALAMFAAAEPAITEALNNFFVAMSALFSDGEFTNGILWAALAMTAMGAASIILGIGLGILAVALMLLPPLTKETAESLLAFFKVFSDHREEFSNGIKDFGMAIIDGLGGIAGELASRAPEFIGGIANSIASADMGPILELGKTIGMKVIEGIGEGLMGLLTIATDLLKQYVFDPLNSGIEQGLEDIGNGINDFFYEHFGIGTDPAVRESGKQIAKELAGGYAEQTAGGLADLVKKTTDEMLTDLDETNEQIESNTIDSIDELQVAVNQKGEGFDFLGALGLTPEILSQGSDKIKEVLSGLGIEVPDELIVSLENGMSGKDFMQAIISSGNIEDFSALESVFDSGGGLSASAYYTGFDKEISAHDITGLINAADNIDIDSLKSNFANAGNAAASAFADSFGESIKIDGSGPIEKAAQALSSGSSKMETSGKDLGKAVEKGFTSGSKDMKSKASAAGSSAVQSIRSKASSAYSGGYSVGENMGRGLKAGLKSGSHGLAAAAAAIVTAAIKAMRLAAAVRSPSKETMWISEMMDKGLIVGLEKLKSDVVATASGVMEDSIFAMASQTSYLSGLLDDIDDNPTIRPVLDLSDYEAGIQRMRGLNASAPMNSAQWANGMFSGRAGEGYYSNSNKSMVINLNYEAGTTAADMVNEMAMILQTKNLMEA